MGMLHLPKVPFIALLLSGSATVTPVAAFHSPLRNTPPPNVKSSARTTFLSESANDQTFEGTVVVCTGPTCSANGGRKALSLWKEIASQQGPDKLIVETMKCVSECAECALGPNVELHSKGDDGPFYPIKNKARTEADIKKILGLL